MHNAIYFLCLLLLIVLGVVLHCYSKTVGGFDEKIAAILVLKTPLGVQEMRKAYIKTDTQPPHITLGYMNDLGDNEKEVFAQLRIMNPDPIVFEQWKHTKSFIGLIPKNVDEIKRITKPLDKYIDTGPRGGYHMSIAYRPHSQDLDSNTHKKAHELISIPITCKVKELRFSKFKNGEWIKYKSILYD